MKVCIVHNEYGKPGGEDVMIKKITKLLKDHDHNVTYFRRSSADISKMRFGKLRAFFSSIYSFSSTRPVRNTGAM